MENATQALIIGASVLIGVMILSLAIYLVYTFGGFNANVQSKIDRNAVTQFNDKFLKYDGQEDLTVQDVITVKNYALEHNKQFSGYNYKVDRAGENNEYIDVYFAKTRNQAYNPSALIFGEHDAELLEDEINSSPEDEIDSSSEERRITCEVKVNPNTARVYKVYFYKN